MAHKKLREDKVCQNCEHTVINRFCGKCGQENTETRRSFHYLFTHVVEDLVHYDGNFLNTIKTLIYKPYELTNTYLEGKRKAFVAPVKLYIFINFLFFLLIGFVSNFDVQSEKIHTLKSDKNSKVTVAAADLDSIKEDLSKNTVAAEVLDSIKNDINETNKKQKNEFKFNVGEEKNKNNFNGLEETLKDYPTLLKKYKFIINNYSTEEITLLLKKNMVASLPKAIFLYLPFFAFFLWLFHNKKKYWFFDHGIFTFHIFSFLLIVMIFDILIVLFFNFIDIDALGIIIAALSSFYTVFIYMKSMHRVYGSYRFVVVLKSLLLFFLNTFLLVFFILGLMFYSFINIH